jgi:GntR family transcriptional regulator
MAFLLDRGARLSYPAQIERQALAHLVAGRFNPGDRLPSVRQMARDLGISRTTAERIQDVLCETMLAEIRPRSGAFVASPDSISRRNGALRVQALYEFLKRTIADAQQLGLDARRLAQLVGAFDEGKREVLGRAACFPVIATRDTFECMVACLGEGFPARLLHLSPDARPSNVPRHTRYLLSGYYLRGRARKLAEAVGCALLYIRYNVTLLDQAMAIPPNEFRYFLTRDADNAETTRGFLGSAYPEIPTSTYAVMRAQQWLDMPAHVQDGGAELWATITAAPLLKHIVASDRVHILHPLLADDLIDELRCLALLG